MRVAFVTYALHVGGMEIFLLTLAEGLRLQRRGGHFCYHGNTWQMA